MRFRRFSEIAMRAVFFAAAFTCVLAVLFICVFLFANGIPAVGEIGALRFLLGTEWSPRTCRPPSASCP